MADVQKLTNWIEPGMNSWIEIWIGAVNRSIKTVMRMPNNELGKPPPTYFSWTFFHCFTDLVQTGIKDWSDFQGEDGRRLLLSGINRPVSLGSEGQIVVGFVGTE